MTGIPSLKPSFSLPCEKRSVIFNEKEIFIALIILRNRPARQAINRISRYFKKQSIVFIEGADEFPNIPERIS
jgi:hypothetical protein